MGEMMYVVQLEIYFKNRELADKAFDDDTVVSIFLDAGIELKKPYGAMMKDFHFFDNCDGFDPVAFDDAFNTVKDDKDTYGIESMHAWIWEMDTEESTAELEG